MLTGLSSLPDSDPNSIKVHPKTYNFVLGHVVFDFVRSNDEVSGGEMEEKRGGGRSMVGDGSDGWR